MLDKYGFIKSLVVNKETYKERLTTCRSCKSFQKTLRLCGECSCFMPAKARAADSTCPNKIWVK
jgi:hypothetical protein